MYTMDLFGEMALIGFLTVIGIYLLLLLLILAAVYVVCSIGLYRIAKASGLPKPARAWIPVVNSYITGLIAQRGAVYFGKKPLPFRKLLPVFQVLTIMLYLLVIALSIGGMFVAAGGVGADAPIDNTEAGLGSVLLTFLTIPVDIVLAVITTLWSIFYYIATWHIFKLFDEKNALPYLLLSIFIPIAQPILFIILGGKPLPSEETKSLPE